MFKLKAYFKTTRLWYLILNSKFYQKNRFPAEYKAYKEEKKFYAEILSGIKHPNDLIFDVGANLGYKSMVFSSLSKKVIAFEPSENTFAHLQRRVKYRNIELYNCALGSNASTLEFCEIPGNEAYSSLSKKHIETLLKHKFTKAEHLTKSNINVETLENFIIKFGVPKYIKIDVEGYEYEVILGLKTAVPFISFEANLPLFCDESVKIIEYLSKISSDKYVFIFTNENFFLLQKFVNKEEAIKFLLHTTFTNMEIYAKLES